MNEASGGQTYEQVSGQYIALSDADKASPDGQALGQLRQTLFMGNTLRGLLLYGYAFATMGTIAGFAAIVSFAGAALLLVLSLLGLWHARRAEPVAAVARGSPAAVYPGRAATRDARRDGARSDVPPGPRSTGPVRALRTARRAGRRPAGGPGEHEGGLVVPAQGQPLAQLLGDDVDARAS